MKKLLVMFTFSFLCTINSSHSQERLAFVCNFAAGYSWASENGKYSDSKTTDNLNLTFTVDSPTEGKMIGNAGITPVSIMNTDSSISFVELTEAGNLSITSIFKPSESAPENKAVHSRHMSIVGNPIVSQYVGNCLTKS